MDLAINILATQTPVAGICNLERLPRARNRFEHQTGSCSSSAHSAASSAGPNNRL